MLSKIDEPEAKQPQVTDTSNSDVNITPSTLPKSDRWVLFGGLASLSLGQAVILSAFGPIARDFGMTEYSVGIIISLSALAAALAAPWWGKKSDAIGHRRVFIFAMIGNLLTTVGFTALLKIGQIGILSGITAFLLLLFMRMTYALTASGGLPAASGIIGQETSKENRAKAMTLIGTAFGFGSLAGAAITFVSAGALGPMGPLWITCAIVTIISLMAVSGWRRRPRNRSVLDENEATESTASKPDRRRFWRFLCIGATAFTATGMVQQVIPFYVQDAFLLDTGAAVQKAGLLAIVSAVFTLGSLQVTARISASPILLLIIGCLTATAGMGLFLVSPTIEILIGSHALLGAGFGLLLPGLQALISLRAKSSEQAAASGYLSAATTMGYVVGPTVGGALYTFHPTAAFTMAMALMAVATILALLIKR